MKFPDRPARNAQPAAHGAVSAARSIQRGRLPTISLDLSSLAPATVARILGFARDCSLSLETSVISLLDSVGERQEMLFANSGAIAPASAPHFTFIDLFAGIGGFRLAMQGLGGRCVFTSEWDRSAQRTYAEWFGELPHGDIRTIAPANIPGHDVLCAGFPCQPFSLAGVSKKASLGRPHGFDDEAQGNLFFDLAAIVAAKRPPLLVLENVKNLLSHDRGRTWQVISSRLTELDYVVRHGVVDARWFVPQHRERVFIVGFRRDLFGNDPAYSVPTAFPTEPPRYLRDILETTPDGKYTLTDKLWGYLQRYAEKHRAAGNGFGFGLADLNGVTRTLSARYHKDGSEILVPQGARRNPRRLTPRECARLMGYPDEFPIVVADTPAYRQFGNSVVPAVVRAVAAPAVALLNETRRVEHASAHRSAAVR